MQNTESSSSSSSSSWSRLRFFLSRFSFPSCLLARAIFARSLRFGARDLKHPLRHARRLSRENRCLRARGGANDGRVCVCVCAAGKK